MRREEGGAEESAGQTLRAKSWREAPAPTCPSLLVALGLLWASLVLHFIFWEMRALTRKDLKVPETLGIDPLRTESQVSATCRKLSSGPCSSPGGVHLSPPSGEDNQRPGDPWLCGVRPQQGHGCGAVVRNKGSVFTEIKFEPQRKHLPLRILK